MKKFAAILLTSILALSALTYIFLPGESFSWQERRPLNQWPEFSFEKLVSGDYFSDIDSALADQFFARNEMLAIKSSAQKYTGQKDNDRVYFGDDNYLIEKNGELNVGQLRNNVNLLFDFAEVFAESEDMREGSFILAPTIAGVEEEFLPNYHLESDQDDIISTLNETASEYNLIAPELIDSLSNYEGDEQLYFRTDHHWTQDGAHAAFQTWLDQSTLEELAIDYTREEISNNFYGTTWAKANIPSIPADSVIAYQNDNLYNIELLDLEGNLIRKNIYNEEAIDTVDTYEYFLGQNAGYIKLQTHADNGEGDLIIFKDSYANAFIPFLIEYYETITIIDLRYLAKPVSEILEEEEFTDLMFLYNVVTLSDESNIYKLLR